jgi:hypothetical protein
VWRIDRGFAQKFADDFTAKSADNGGDFSSPAARRVLAAANTREDSI